MTSNGAGRPPSGPCDRSLLSQSHLTLRPIWPGLFSELLQPFKGTVRPLSESGFPHGVRLSEGLEKRSRGNPPGCCKRVSPKHLNSDHVTLGVPQWLQV